MALKGARGFESLSLRQLLRFARGYGWQARCQKPPKMATYSFGSFELDARHTRLTRDGASVAISERHLRVLLHLVSQAGTIVSKDALVAAAWGDVAVTDNSLEQAISSIRRTLGLDENGATPVETVPRQGYRFAGAVSRSASRETDEALDALIAPHRAWLEGRAALETLKRDKIALARHAFERAVARLPDLAAAHVGLANAAVMEFEATRADALPDIDSLKVAVNHAREACRLDPSLAEGWATLGFVLARVDRASDALAASRRAVALEPDNWRHQFRLSSIAWGEERLRAAKRTLALVAGFPLAHYLAATVHVARQAFDAAERELRAGIANESSLEGTDDKFGGIALHWLLGLILLSRGQRQAAFDEFNRELALEPRGHMYTREVCANTFYAIGVMHRHQDDLEAARTAFEQAFLRRPGHAMSRLGLAALNPSLSAAASLLAAEERAISPADKALARAAISALQTQPVEAARIVDEALTESPPGSAFWLLPLEPLLRVYDHPAIWAAPLARLRTRGA